ncbi:MAG TPA: glycosyltransferase family 4 protein [Pyrinomonadaceae bacterium]|nr:glycosyltransferase family 4 protein [Pyrinomonadaceae bacterium]
MKWICCQLGAREHYAVPRALQRSGLLGEFITDLWMRFAGRFHPGLASAPVSAPNLAALKFEFKAYVTGAKGWNLISQRNEWFQQRAIDTLQKRPTNGPRTVFAYSYAAEQIFKLVRERGWRTILGQIDPGPAEERIVAGLNENGSGCEPAPAEYWNQWRSECALADKVVVNSAWSRDALFAEGVPEEKIRVLPLAYEAAGESKSFQRHYPTAFTSARPLRVLFLGQINVRKGVAPLLEAVKLLAREHVEFWFVGPTQVNIPAELRDHPRVKWFGVVPRVDVDKYYKDADVFILPTLSDGFGLTQLEAQSWKLPVVASRYCGEVVCDGVNGVILNEVSGEAIAHALLEVLRTPERLSAMSEQSGINDRFSLRTLASSLRDL